MQQAIPSAALQHEELQTVKTCHHHQETSYTYIIPCKHLGGITATIMIGLGHLNSLLVITCVLFKLLFSNVFRSDVNSLIFKGIWGGIVFNMNPLGLMCFKQTAFLITFFRFYLLYVQVNAT